MLAPAMGKAVAGDRCNMALKLGLQVVWQADLLNEA